MTEQHFNPKISYAIAIVSGILLILSYPPFNFAILAWIAFVPWLIVLYYEYDLKRLGKANHVRGLILAPISLWIGFMLGDYLTLFVPSLASFYWFLVIVGVGIFALTAFHKEWPAILGWRAKEIPPKNLNYIPPKQYKVLQIFIPPIMWTASEFLTMSLPIFMKIFGAVGFFSLAKTQWQNIPLIQLASFTGMYGITFLILLVNCTIAYAIVNYKEFKSISKQSITVITIVIIIFVALWANVPDKITGTVNITIIHAPPKSGEELSERYAELTLEAIENHEPQLVLWSFWAIGAHYGMTGPDPNMPSVLGPDPLEYKNLSSENDLYLVGGEGTFIYPNGTVIHFPTTFHVLNLLDGLIPPNIDLQKAIFPKSPSYDTNFGDVGFLFCMEGGFPQPTRQLVNYGVDFVIITTGEVSETILIPQQFVSNAVYRAVENGIPIIHVMNNRESVIVDPYGRIVNTISTAEITVGKLCFTSKPTFYSKFGDIFGLTIVLLFVVISIYNTHLKRKSDFKYCEFCRAKIEKLIMTCPQCHENLEKPPLWKRIILHEYYEHKRK